MTQARAKAAYEAYAATTGWKNFLGRPIPQFDEVPDVIRAAWMNACTGALKHWLETDFRQGVKDDALIEQAAATLKVAKENGATPLECVRACIATFVIDMVDPKALGGGQSNG